MGEEKIKEMLSTDFYPYLCQPDILDCVFSDFPKLQRSGVDLVLTFPQLKLEIKTRDAKWNTKEDILLETGSVVINGNIEKEGWILTSKADIILYLWWSDDTKQKFKKGYLLFPKKIYPFLRIWYNDPQYRKYYAPNKGYLTENLAMPIPVLLSTQTIKPIVKDYNAILKQWFD